MFVYGRERGRKLEDNLQVRSLLSLCGSQGLNSGHESWLKVPLANLGAITVVNKGILNTLTSNIDHKIEKTPTITLSLKKYCLEYNKNI